MGGGGGWKDTSQTGASDCRAAAHVGLRARGEGVGGNVVAGVHDVLGVAVAARGTVAASGVPGTRTGVSAVMNCAKVVADLVGCDDPVIENVGGN